MKFSDINGKESTKEYLRNLVNRDRIPHAFLFTGRQGSGKLALALAMASYIQCIDRKNGDSCGECASCRKARGLIHPDIHYVMPTISKDGKSQPSTRFYEPWRQMVIENPYFDLNDWMNKIQSGNKQGNIPKDSILEIIKNFSLKIFEGKKKVGIIWQSELMQGEGNRLLKMIEEPPENSVFILIAEDPEKVLNTIISRCQIIQVPPFSDQDLMEFSKSKLDLKATRIEQIVQVANGNIIELIKIAGHTNTDLYDRLFDWLRLTYRANAAELVAWTNEFATLPKDDQKYFFKYVLSFFEQFLLSFSLERSALRITDEAYSTGQKMKGLLDTDKTIQIIEMLNASIINIERNANVKLQMMNSSLTLHRIMTGK